MHYHRLHIAAQIAGSGYNQGQVVSTGGGDRVGTVGDFRFSYPVAVEG